MRGLEKLFPPVASAAMWFKQLAENNGFKIQVTETLRTSAGRKALSANCENVNAGTKVLLTSRDGFVH